MTAELKWLLLTALMTALFWVPYVLNRMAVVGIFGAVAGPSPDNRLLSPWAQRAIKAHDNAIENLAIFATVVLTAHVLSVSTPLTAAAAALYFFARLVHFIVYTLSLPLIRTLSFTAGWVAQIVFIAACFHWI